MDLHIGFRAKILCVLICLTSNEYIPSSLELQSMYIKSSKNPFQLFVTSRAKIFQHISMDSKMTERERVLGTE